MELIRKYAMNGFRDSCVDDDWKRRFKDDHHGSGLSRLISGRIYCVDGDCTCL